ncbi:hypothetical protein VNO78_20390 [Psophocarpus tetragonolobus]|uniref:FAF domain-containing protein n=1 Tax=Psophocarpus tetragonolobus TaxID=3891 RepID=A0AAN9SA76_PSOTE
MMVFFLYVSILLSLFLSFLLHVFNKRIHLFLMDLVITFSTTMHVLDSPPPPKQIGFINNVGKGIERLMACTESLGFQSIDINDEIDDNDTSNDENEDENYWWRKVRVKEGKGNFPPPLSSMNVNGQPSFVLVPIRQNGRLKLSKVSIKRPEILYATRQDGRLRLFLFPDHCVEDDVEEQQELVSEFDIEEQELVNEFDTEEHMEEEKAMIIESMEDEKDDEIISYEQNDVRIGEWRFPNEGFGKCYDVLNHIQQHHHLNMYAFSIA